MNYKTWTVWPKKFTANRESGLGSYKMYYPIIEGFDSFKHLFSATEKKTITLTEKIFEGDGHRQKLISHGSIVCVQSSKRRGGIG